jgi:predicted ArsR family transcriptional regulator
LWDPRLFQTTRGKVLLHIKKHGACTVAYLSRELGLTPNAIRQHLSSLARDNLVSQRALKAGPSKPAQAYFLTPQAESLFPKGYDGLLLDLLQELLHQHGEEETCRWLSRVGYSRAAAYVNETAGLEPDARVAVVGRILEESGSLPEWEGNGWGLTLRNFNCPYALVSRDHPQACEAQRSFLQRLFSPAAVETACEHQQGRCRFHITPAMEGAAAVQPEDK